jgi:outer membrane lipoprotein carrier protein
MLIRIRPLLTPVLAAALAASAAAQQAQPPAADVAAELQRKYDSIRDFSADFTQTYEGGVLRRKANAERGTVFIKKPGKMRWNYKSPEEKVFVSDGRQMQLYVPADRQVVVSDVPAEDRATSAILFLMGRGNLVRDFDIRHADGATDSTYVLRLDPKIRQTDYDWLQVTIDRKSFRILELTAGDQQGGRSTFRFSNFKENPGVSDKTFAFTPPRGTDIVKSGQPR